MEEQLVHLPIDVVLEEIIARVPVESLIRFRTTCRAFYNRTFDKDYICRHLDLSRKRFLRLVEKVHLIDPVTNAVKFTDMPHCISHGYNISSVIHCDGLLLCKNRQTCTLNLWNPYKKPVRQILPMDDFLSEWDYYGMGYCRDRRSHYRVLRIYDGELYPEDGRDQVEVEIYETRAHSWRRVDATPLDWQVDGSRAGLSVKGNMYWIARAKVELRSGIPSFIQCFDFSKETFSPIGALPIELHYDQNHTYSLSIYKEEALSLLYQGQAAANMELWVTNPLGNGDIIWTRRLSVAKPDLPQLRPHCNFSYPVHFINREDELVLLCRKENGDYKDEEGHYYGDSQICLYKLGKEGIRHRLDLGQGFLFEHVMCAYVYSPGLVSVYCY